MEVIFASLLILIILISKVGFGTLKTPVSTYSIIWCIVGFVANLGLYGYYPPSGLVNWIMIFGIIIFFAVYGLGFLGVNKSFFKYDIKLENIHINVKILLIINIIAIMVMIPSIRTSLTLLQNNELWYIRANASEVYSSGLMATLVDSIIRPLFVATTVLAVVYSFSDGSKKLKTMLLTLAAVENIELVVCTAGRASIVNFLFYFLITMILFRGENFFCTIEKRKKKNIICNCAYGTGSYPYTNALIYRYK